MAMDVQAFASLKLPLNVLKTSTDILPAFLLAETASKRLLKERPVTTGT